nr:MAG TPA: hypothetical protein [Caudoviricetes sp.]
MTYGILINKEMENEKKRPVAVTTGRKVYMTPKYLHI